MANNLFKKKNKKKKNEKKNKQTHKFGACKEA